jgi:hypothetical protein
MKLLAGNLKERGKLCYRFAHGMRTSDWFPALLSSTPSFLGASSFMPISIRNVFLKYSDYLLMSYFITKITMIAIKKRL